MQEGGSTPGNKGLPAGMPSWLQRGDSDWKQRFSEGFKGIQESNLQALDSVGGFDELKEFVRRTSENGSLTMTKQLLMDRSRTEVNANKKKSIEFTLQQIQLAEAAVKEAKK